MVQYARHRRNLYLYQVTPNVAWRNADLPTRNSDGQLVQRPRAAFDLHYLLTFYGNEAQLEPQRLVGSVVRILHAQPLLTRQMIRSTITAATFDYLADSDLADEIEMVKFTPLPLSLEELSKLWSVFFQTPYTLSLAYEGMVIFIEAAQLTRQALPVRERNVYVRAFRQPVIERVESQAGEGQPVVAGSTLVIGGKRLRGDVTRVRVGGIEVTPAPRPISETEIACPSRKSSGRCPGRAGRTSDIDGQPAASTFGLRIQRGRIRAAADYKSQAG